MPVYQAEMTRDQLEKERRRNVCSVCGGWLNCFLDDNHRIFIACADWPRSHHEGIAREFEAKELTIEAGREQMTTELGIEKSRVLEQYKAPGTVITESIATKIVETLWKEAPAVEKAKAIMLAHQYQLNPLKKHLYILGPFKKWNKDHTRVIKEEWAVVEGIGATRLQARRKHRFTYRDLSPRRATKDELDKILGDEMDPTKLYVITLLKDLNSGGENYGLGSWPKADKAYGQEEGNSAFNMASIRSERQAYERLYPGDFPDTGLELMDERYLPDVLPQSNQTAGAKAKPGTTIIDGESRDIDTETGEIFDEPTTEEKEAAAGQGPTLEDLKRDREKLDEAIKRIESKDIQPGAQVTPLDVRMIRAAAVRLKWDKTRLDKEVSERSQGKTLEVLTNDELHNLASKLTDLAECA